PECPQDCIKQRGLYSSRSRQKRAQLVRASLKRRVEVRSSLVGGAGGREPADTIHGVPGPAWSWGVVVAREYSPSSGFLRDSMGTSPAPATTPNGDANSGPGFQTPVAPQLFFRQERHPMEDFV